MPELYPTYRKTLLNEHQEQILTAMLEAWKESEMKADPVLMQETLDAIDEIVSGTYNLPQPYKTPMARATARALARKKQREQEEREQWKRIQKEWLDKEKNLPRSVVQQLISEIRDLKYRTERPWLRDVEVPAAAGTQKRKPRAKKIRAGSKAKRTKAKT